MSFPKFVEFREEGPREGFQIEKTIYPIEERAELINMISETGVKTIQVGSFVSPKYVPQMADTADLFDLITKKPGIAYTGLWLNEKGFHAASAVDGIHLDARLFFYASDKFSWHNNNRSAADMQARQRDWIKLYQDHGLPVSSAYVMAAFGCNMEGNIPQDHVLGIFDWCVRTCEEMNAGLPELYIADTMGWGTPDSVKRMIEGVRQIAPDARIGMHIHDTRGMGIANLYAALELGVDLFDSSLAGLGGCPFAGHGSARAAGNVCTEDAVFLCNELGIETGIDLDKMIAAANKAEEIIGSPLMGRTMRSGGLDAYRAAS
ncbi:MAG: hydroxymethylglutaryl-CoA lyase [Pseudomonadota bacterium]